VIPPYRPGDFSIAILRGSAREARTIIGSGEEMLAACGIVVSHETVRQWALKFGQAFANEIRRRLVRAGDKRHLDEAVIKIAGKTHWLYRVRGFPRSARRHASLRSRTYGDISSTATSMRG
jgi:hypothetical protein